MRHAHPVEVLQVERVRVRQPTGLAIQPQPFVVALQRSAVGVTTQLSESNRSQLLVLTWHSRTVVQSNLSHASLSARSSFGMFGRRCPDASDNLAAYLAFGLYSNAARAPSYGSASARYAVAPGGPSFEWSASSES